MAGIGFKIQKILDRDSYISAMQGFTLGAFVSSGPLIIVVLTIGLLSYMSALHVTRMEVVQFRATLVYVYMISLIVSGFLQLFGTRYVADCLYSKDYDRIVPTMNALLITSTVLNAIFASIVFLPLQQGPWYTYRAVALTCMVSNVWMAMIFVTATKQYLTTAFSFVAGSAVAIFCGYTLGRTSGIIGYLEGFAIGQTMIVIILAVLVAREFPCKKAFDFGFLTYLRRYPELAAIGLLFNLGMWADKLILWWSDFGTPVVDYMRSFDLYDSVTFVAYLSVIPSATFFLVTVETSFYLKYRRFYGVITGRGSLVEIEQAHTDMMDGLTEGVASLAKVQFTVCMLCIIFAGPIMWMFSFSPLQWGMLRISFVGALLLVMVQLLSIIMLYFELRKEALLVTIAFSLGNAFFTWLTVQLGFRYLGLGMPMAALVALVIGYLLLAKNLKSLIYLTFCTQPIPKPVH